MSARPHRFFLGGRRYSPAASLLLTAPFLLIVALVFVLPLAALLHESAFMPKATLAHYQRVFEQPAYLRVMFRTVRIAAIVTVATLLLGYPLAWAMTKRKGLGLALLIGCVLLPLWTSVLVRT